VVTTRCEISPIKGTFITSLDGPLIAHYTIKSRCASEGKGHKLLIPKMIEEPVFLEVLHDVSTVLARELPMIVLDVSLQSHLVAKHSTTVGAGMLLGAVEVLLNKKSWTNQWPVL
jgi:hypothetical protein